MEDLIQNTLNNVLAKDIEYNIGYWIYYMTILWFVLIIIEICHELYTKKVNIWRLKEIGANFSVAITYFLTESLGKVLILNGLVLFFHFIPWEIPINPWTTIACLILVDLLYYIEHRLEHEIRLLWGYHSVHHSSPVYNFSTSLRVAFFGKIFTVWYLFIPILFGFHPVIILACAAFLFTYQFWIHNEVIKKMGWLEKIFVTPSHHRVHHGSDDIYLDKNYGGILIIWDKMFGTFQEELHQPTYGLTTQINTINPIKVHFYEYINIFKDLRKAKSLGEAWNYLFKPPGWKPEK